MKRKYFAEQLRAVSRQEGLRLLSVGGVHSQATCEIAKLAIKEAKRCLLLDGNQTATTMTVDGKVYIRVERLRR